VKYKSNQNQKPEGSSDLPNLLQLEHVLHASKLQSNLRYCWDSKLMRGLMSSVAETPEIVLARENAKKISDTPVTDSQSTPLRFF
ncbi:hypothetical protein E3U43_014703, partial [Larimichthys crocea]